MTLALYGKSRKRQGSLLLAALLAILAASVGGLAIISSAFAHNANTSASSTCNGDWSSRLWYENGGSSDPGDLRLVLIRDVKVNNAAYSPTWASGVGDGTNSSNQTNGQIVARGSYGGSQTGLPSVGSHTDYIWVGVDSTFDIFNRNQTTGALNSNASAWGGGASIWAWNGSSWVDQNFSANVTQPPAASDCAKIVIKKVVTGTGASASQGFTADLVNETTGGLGDGTNKAFSQAVPYDGAYFDPGSTGDNFNATEDAVPANWTLTGKKVIIGSSVADCGDTGWTTVSGTSASDRRVDFNDLDRGEVATVCFRNEYTTPSVQINISTGACADVQGPGFTYHFNAPQGTEGGSGGGVLTVTFKYDNGAAEPAIQVNEDTDGNGHPDWHPFIPWNGHSSITILSATSANGGVWSGNGDETVSTTQCPSTKIIVKKTVTGTNPPATSFPVSIDDLGNGAGTDYSGSIASGTDYTQPLADVAGPGDSTGASDNDDFKVTEGDSGVAGWTTVGWAIISTQTTCDADVNGGQSGDGFTAGSIASGGNLNDLDIGDTVVVCFKNQYNQPQVINPSVDKSDTSDSTPNLGESFNYTLKFTVPSGSATTADFTVQDAIPSNFTVGTVTPDTSGTPLHCSKSGNTVTCTLNSGAAANGVFIATIPVTVKNDSVCGPVVNSVFKDTTSGDKLDDDTVNISGCGDITYNKTSVGIVSGALRWNIHFVNSSVLQGSITVYDLNSTYVSGPCTDNNNDTYTCTVAGSSTADLVVSTPLPQGFNAVCDNIDQHNTVSISGNLQSSDTAEYSQTAEPDKSCLTVTKDKSDTSQPPTWVINVTSTADSALTIFVKDTGATYGGLTIGSQGTCGVSVGTSMDPGFTCNVDANGHIGIIVTKPYPETKTCEGTDVPNSAEVYLGTFNDGSPEWQPTGGTFENLNQDTSLCTRDVTVCKVVVANGDGVIVPSFGYGFDIRQTNRPNISGSNSVGEVNPDTDNSQSSEVCTTKQVPNDLPFDVVEWGSRPAGWTTDASGYPMYSIDGGALVSNNTIPSQAAGTSDVKVTFYNKETPRTKQILITKDFVNLNGYTPVAGDIPSFALNPSTDTSCEAPYLDGENGYATIVCTVPADWDGTVDETVPANWTKVECVQFSLVQAISGLVGDVLPVVAEYADYFNFCNAPVGKITVIKDDETSADNPGRPANWQFEVDGSDSFQHNENIALGGGSFTITAPLASGYSADETNGHFNVADFCSTVSNPNGDGYQSVNQTPGTQAITFPGEEITFMFKNADCGVVLGTGHLDIYKVRDINGNGVMDGSDSNIAWTVTITGPEFPGGQNFNVPAGGLHLDGLTEGAYTITEGLQFGYTLVGVITSENGSLVVSGTTQIALHNDETDTVTFYNKPYGQIPVHKNAFTSHNGGANVVAPNDDDGWTITLTSVDCGISEQAVTDSNGDALFSNLPLCTDYVVSEGAVNASSPGFVPLTGTKFTNITPNGVTLTFNNILRTNDPICTVGCTPVTTTPTTTPTSTPTNTPTTTTTATPTTPAATNTPTNTPTPVSTQLGEKTPGPGQTPIAPSTGTGLFGGTTGGFNILLILGGLLALTSGLSFVALGRKSRR
jgi:fimbrial isopeptide formation D2 family protein